MHARRGMTLALVVSSCWTVALSAQDRFPIQRLTFDPAQEGFPSWSPDGRMLVYSYGTDRASGPIAGLHLVASTGGRPEWLTHEIGEHPNWSREGHYIVFDAEEGNSIKVTSASGGPISAACQGLPDPPPLLAETSDGAALRGAPRADGPPSTKGASDVPSRFVFQQRLA